MHIKAPLNPGNSMRAIYLNSAFVEAIEAQGLNIKNLADQEVMNRYFSSTDQYIMEVETTIVLSTYPLVNSGIVSYWGGEVVETSHNSDSTKNAYTAHADVVADSRKLLCAPYDETTIVLYATKDAVEVNRNPIENVLMALALIMPVQAVMQTAQFGHYTRAK